MLLFLLDSSTSIRSSRGLVTNNKVSMCLSFLGDYAVVLQQLKMTLWDTDKCNSSIAWNGEIFDTFLCAGYYSGVRSICKVRVVVFLSI